MGVLNIAPKQWLIAKAFFNDAANANVNKLSKKSNKQLDCSFIKVKNVLYAMANGTYLGEGGFSKVKIVETEQGMNYVVKIEGKKTDERTMSEFAAMNKLGKFIGSMERTLPVAQDFWKGKKEKPHMTQHKTYKLVLKEEGTDLFDQLYPPSKPLSDIQRLIIAIRICQGLALIHEHNVIHADLKPNNMLATIDGNRIKVAILDFGFSMILENGQTHVVDKVKGTEGYIAPEIYNPVNIELSKREFSYASDIYALGALFINNLKLDKTLFENMMAEDPADRPKLSAVLDSLKSALAKEPELDEIALEVLNGPTLKPAHRPLPKPPLNIVRHPLPVPAVAEAHLPLARLRAEQNKKAPMMVQLNNELKMRLAISIK